MKRLLLALLVAVVVFILFMHFTSGDAFGQDKEICRVDITGFAPASAVLPKNMGKYEKDFYFVVQKFNSDTSMVLNIIGCADGLKYNKPWKPRHSEFNASLSIARRQKIYDYLKNIGLKADETRVSFGDKVFEEIGPEYRKVVLILTKRDFATKEDVEGLAGRVETLESQKPVEKESDFQLRLGPGFSFGPFDDPDITASALLKYKYFGIEAEVGTSPVTDKIFIQNARFETRSRFASASLHIYPIEWLSVVMGYERDEDILTARGDYWRKFEGFAFGLGLQEDFGSLKVLFLAGDEQNINRNLEKHRNDFRVSANFNLLTLFERR